MILYKQITDEEEIRFLSSYYILKFRTKDTETDTSEESVLISMLQISNYQVTREAVAEFVTGQSSEEQLAFSLSRLLFGSCVVAEKEDLVLLRHLLEKYGHEGEIQFLPITQLATAVFPALTPGNLRETATQLHIPDPEEHTDLEPCYLTQTVLRRCQVALGAELPAQKSDEELEDARSISSQGKQKRGRTRAPRQISNHTLKRWAEGLWSEGPWLLIGITLLLVFFAFLFYPHKSESIIDRDQAPNHYLVLSWDKTGKYGTRPKKKSGQSDTIQFRIPYGVYTVWNNNSVPVELNVISEDDENSASVDESETEDAQDTANAEGSEESNEAVVTLSVSQKAASAEEDDENEDNGNQSRVIMRPNSNRQITVDKNQYVTLSEDASNLIFFYVSEVPEEKESDTTGNEGSASHVVYAYVKGTEVRFRKAPSLEGQIYSALSNGQQVQVLGVTGEWTHVIVGDQKGYIFSQYLSSEDPSALNVAVSQSDVSQDDETAESPMQDSDQQSDNAGDLTAQDDAVSVSGQPADETESPVAADSSEPA